MRPITLEIDGIGSFRQPTTINFDGADLFAITGLTGGGKSTIVDCMTLAAYGAAPRHGTSTIAPLLSSGRKLGKVRFVFDVGGDRYTAVRVLNRTKTSVTTKEARLEDAAGGVVAGDAAGVTAAITRLLGLNFVEFCRTVVLPQGRFAEFLHATPKERQDLLVELLDLGLYRQMGEQAREEAKQLEMSLAGDRKVAEGLAHATEQVVADAAERVATLEQLADTIDSYADRLSGIKADGQEARTAADAARKVAEVAAATTVPASVAALLEEHATATGKVEQADDAATTADEVATDLEDAASKLPTVQVLDQLLQDIGKIDRSMQAVHDLGTHRDSALTDAKVAAAAHREAATAVEQARRSEQQLRDLHAAYVLAAGLQPGDACPVCVRPVDQPPSLPVPHSLADAETDVACAIEHAEDLERQAAEAQSRASQLSEKLAADEATLTSLIEQVATTAAGLTALPDPLDVDQRGIPDPDQVEQARARVAQAVADAATARQAAAAAASQATTARQALTALDARVNDAWTAYHQARDLLAGAGAPAPDAGDLAGSWQALAGWAADNTARLQTAADDADDAVEAVSERWRTLAGELREVCAAANVTVDQPERAVQIVGSTLGDARARAERLTQEAETAAELAEQIAADEAALATWSDLGRLLKVNAFERWLLERATRQLAQAASATLLQLTSDAYSLDLDDKGGFVIVDHTAAGERRPAKSLSGGETFLASLALALALADQVTAAAGRTAQLDTLLLDEGFGTLDPSTLDVVAAAIDDLSSVGNRTVGLITHVEALAARMPVRYDVAKTPSGSTVTRTNTA